MPMPIPIGIYTYTYKCLYPYPYHAPRFVPSRTFKSAQQKASQGAHERAVELARGAEQLAHQIDSRNELLFARALVRMYAKEPDGTASLHSEAQEPETLMARTRAAIDAADKRWLALRAVKEIR